ncbi:hypothetical protein Tco_0989824 [Tanacetum coccineum]|uniref:CCHC-type domain-containing protein n=1 Tax=Tanacetum coccineum TaxID=301880 RepID=A0ABQ5EV07_9ASTR
MIPNIEKLLEAFIRVLPRSIEGNVTTSKPQTLEEAINIAQRQEAVRAYAATLAENNRYAGNLSLCRKCDLHHTGPCTVKCNTCNKVGHLTKNYQNKRPATRSNQLPVTVICHACEEKGHYTNQCRKTNINAQGRAYMLRDRNAHQDPNVVTSRSLPAEWNTHVVVWRNKPDLETISIDDLYNNFKIVKQEVKRSVTFSSNSGSQNLAFVSALSSTNDVNTANVHVSIASSSLSAASTSDNAASLSDAIVYAFLANQPNSMRARRYFQKTRKKITINGSDIAGYDKTKMELDLIRALWERRKSLPTLLLWHSQTQRIELNKYEFDLANYKRGLASVEEQLVFYKKNKGMLCDQIAILKRDVLFNESEINALRIQIERLKKEKEINQIKIDNFENASKSLDKLIGSQISDNNRKGMGYNVVAPLPIGLFVPPTIDLSNSGLKEFKQPEFEGYNVRVNKSVCENASKEVKKTSDAPIIEDWASDFDEDESVVKVLKYVNVQQKSKQADEPRKFSHPRTNRTNWNAPLSQKLGMVQKPVLNNEKRGTGQRVVRPVWNNVMRTNHQKFSNSRRNFTPTTVLTKSGLINSVNTAKGKRVTSVVGGQGINVVKPTTCWVWRPKRNVIDHLSKNSGSYICKPFDYVDPTGRLKSVMA